MTSNYPNAAKTFTDKVDNKDAVLAAHINDVQDEIAATQKYVGLKSELDVTGLPALPAGKTDNLPGYLSRLRAYVATSVSNSMTAVSDPATGLAKTYQYAKEAWDKVNTSTATLKEVSDKANKTESNLLSYKQSAGALQPFSLQLDFTLAAGNYQAGSAVMKVASITHNGVALGYQPDVLMDRYGGSAAAPVFEAWQIGHLDSGFTFYFLAKSDYTVPAGGRSYHWRCLLMPPAMRCDAPPKSSVSAAVQGIGPSAQQFSHPGDSTASAVLTASPVTSTKGATTDGGVASFSVDPSHLTPFA